MRQVVAHVTCEFSGNASTGNFEIIFLDNCCAPKQGKMWCWQYLISAAWTHKRKDVSSASKFCEIISRWGKTQGASSLSGREKFWVLFGNHGGLWSKVYSDTMIYTVAEIAWTRGVGWRLSCVERLEGRWPAVVQRCEEQDWDSGVWAKRHCFVGS